MKSPAVFVDSEGSDVVVSVTAGVVSSTVPFLLPVTADTIMIIKITTPIPITTPLPLTERLPHLSFIDFFSLVIRGGGVIGLGVGCIPDVVPGGVVVTVGGDGVGVGVTSTSAGFFSPQ